MTSKKDLNYKAKAKRDVRFEYFAGRISILFQKREQVSDVGHEDNDSLMFLLN